jgi:hypothetical protein
MVGRGHTKETVGLLNVNSTTPRFPWYDHDLPSKRVFKCIEFTFNNPTVSLVSPRPTIEEGI